ncbi:serine/arginine repetitive matrix protein 1-like [Macrobrachium nipponense]|uniref:serine/arginine repetitive matrix protein 1-like n=1 Tax=Macrobrachium nipponense TaxID=159736 RepID=UPI0030C88200
MPAQTQHVEGSTSFTRSDVDPIKTSTIPALENRSSEIGASSLKQEFTDGYPKDTGSEVYSNATVTSIMDGISSIATKYPHTACCGCRVVECSLENTCNECERLSAQEWRTLTSYLKKLEKDRERKAAYKSRSRSRSHEPLPSSVASSSHNYSPSLSGRSQIANLSDSASEIAELKASLQKMQEKMAALEGKQSEGDFSSDISVPSVVEPGCLCDAPRPRPLPSSLAQRRRKVESQSVTSQTARDRYRKSILRECFSSSGSPSPKRGWKDTKLSHPLKRNWKEPELNSSPERFSEEAPSVVKRARKELTPWAVRESLAPSRFPSPALDEEESSTRKILINMQEQLASLVGVLSKEPSRRKDDKLPVKRSRHRSPVRSNKPSRGNCRTGGHLWGERSTRQARSGKGRNSCQAPGANQKPGAKRQEYSERDAPAKRQATIQEDPDKRQESIRRQAQIIQDSPKDRRREEIALSPSPVRSFSFTERKKSKEETDERRELSPSDPLNLEDLSEDESSI